MSDEKTKPDATRTDVTSPISQVNSRVMSPERARQARNAGGDLRLAQARRSFASLVAAAEDPPLRQRVNFKIDGLGELKTTTLKNFRLVDEKTDGRTGFTVSFERQGVERLQHKTGSEVAHKALRKALYNHGLAFRSASSATVHKIEVDPKIPAYLMITVDQGAKEAGITLNNISMLGEISYRLPADKLDRRIVDALVALISDSDPAFFDLINKVGRG